MIDRYWSRLLPVHTGAAWTKTSTLRMSFEPLAFETSCTLPNPTSRRMTCRTASMPTCGGKLAMLARSGTRRDASVMHTHAHLSRHSAQAGIQWVKQNAFFNDWMALLETSAYASFSGLRRNDGVLGCASLL